MKILPRNFHLKHLGGYKFGVGMAIRAWPAGSARRKNAGRARIMSPHRPARAGPQARIKLKKKNLHLCILITSFMDSCINISNSYITGKDKYYVIFNVLKCKEYIVYVIV